MNLFRIKVSVPGSARFAFVGLFKDGFEAAFQAQADWPEAASISVIHITGSTS
jgi:UDP-N-acetylmuramyl pentapeptide synthase